MKYSLLVVLSFFTLPAIALAGGSEGFVPLVGIPGLSNASAPTFDDYVDALYALAISVAALIAVIQIVLGGAQYMMDDLISSKSAAKERIKNALIGLLIIIAAALILTTINSNLTKLDIKAPAINIDNDKPQLTLEEAFAQGFCQSGNGCKTHYCSSPYMSKLDTNTSVTCQQRCLARNGFYNQGTRTTTMRNGQEVVSDTSSCSFTNNQLSEINTNLLKDILDKVCPSGKTCYAESCSNYGVEYRTYSCSSACVGGVIRSGLGGLHYDSVTDSCIFVGPTNQDKATPCEYRGCQQERNTCAASGGYVASATEAPLEIRCRIPEAQQIVCPVGQHVENVDVQSCVDSICATNVETQCVAN